MSIDPTSSSTGECAGRLWIERVARIDSTNQELMRRPQLLPAAAQALTPPPEGVWLVADEQTAGRGRRGRQWVARPGDSMTASFARELPPGGLRHLAAMPLVAGIVIAEYLAALGVVLGVKWPNDLCRRLPDPRRPYAKVGGILCEVRSRGDGGRLVIGCGLNLRATPDDLVADQPVAALFDELSQVDTDSLVQGVGQALLAGSEQLLHEGFASFVARWQPLDVLGGREIRVHRADGPRDGVALGIDAQGCLLVRYDDAPGHVEVLMAEDLSVRPRG